MSKVLRTYDEINEKIRNGDAVVFTAEEFKQLADEQGIKKAAERVDVVTTGTFSPMCSSGVFLNFGHSDPPIKMSRVWLNDVPAYAGLAAVDAYLGATELCEGGKCEYGGAHVIEGLVSGREIRLKAAGCRTDCYPAEWIETSVDKNSLNECILFNPRNAYQNYSAATNSMGETLYTYMGTLLPRFGNITYSTSGELSPLLNDPLLRTIGVGTRIFFGGAQGFVAWNGTQHNPEKPRSENGTPVGPGCTLSLIGDLKAMNSSFIKAAVFHNYGVSLFVGVGIPIPVLDDEMALFLAVRDRDIQTHLVDYGVPRRSRPSLKIVNYEQLKSGALLLDGRKIPTAPLSSMYKAREISSILKTSIMHGEFLIQEPVFPLPGLGSVKPLDVKECELC